MAAPLSRASGLVVDPTRPNPQQWRAHPGRDALPTPAS